MATTTPKRRGRPPNAKGGDGRKLNRKDNQPEEVTETSQTVAAGQLRAFIERVERLQEEAKTIREDIKEVFAEMKGTGFDTVAVRVLIRLRGMDQAQRQEREAILDLYKSALGMA